MLFSKKDEQEILIKIDGMHCEMCQKRMQKAFMDTKGVVNAEVDLASKTAKVIYDAKKINADSVKNIVTDTGYELA